MARDYIECLDTETMPWETYGDRGHRARILSRDHETGAVTFVLDVPGNWASSTVSYYHTHVEEVYHLSGSISLDGERFYRTGDYLYRPAYIVHGFGEHSNEGVRSLIKLSATQDWMPAPAPAGSSRDEYALPQAVYDRPHVQYLETTRMPWQERGSGEQRLRFKTLSRNEQTGAATYLMEFPAGWRTARGPHYHSHPQEVYVLEGELSFADGPTLRQGCYSYRPAGTLHAEGAHTERGCLLLSFHDEGPLDFHYPAASAP